MKLLSKGEIRPQSGCRACQPPNTQIHTYTNTQTLKYTITQVQIHKYTLGTTRGETPVDRQVHGPCRVAIIPATKYTNTQIQIREYTWGETPVDRRDQGPIRVASLPATTTIASYRNPIVPRHFFQTPPTFSRPFPFLLVSTQQQVASMCVKLFRMHPGALNKHTRAGNYRPILVWITSKNPAEREKSRKDWKDFIAIVLSLKAWSLHEFLPPAATKY